MEPQESGTNPLFLVWQLARRVDPLVGAAAGELSAADFGLYSLLRVAGPMTPSDIRERTGSPSSTISQHVSRLVSRGHAEQRANPEDARSTLVALTDEGIAMHEQAAPTFRELLDRVRAALGEDWDAVIAAMERLDGALRTVADPAATLSPPRPVLGDRAPLTATQRQELQRFEQYLRWRDHHHARD